MPVSALFAQSVTLEFNSLAGTKNQLPFWLWANQLGQYDKNSSTIQNLGLTSFYQKQPGDSDFNLEAGFDLDLLLANDNNVRFTQLFGGINWRFLQLQIGAFPEKEVYAGLSTTNGNLAASRNARPHPRIRAGFNRFVPVFVDWFSINGFYEEGLLNDNRYVEDTHLHRKALYVRLGKPKIIEFTGGLEHFVMWGGTHPTYGELQGWEAYFDYVKGSKGDENSLETDQINVMGNGYGTYQVQLRKNWKKLQTIMYISHPYDDISGMILENYEDNLYGLHLNFTKNKAFIQNVVFEYFYTKNQSGKYHQVLAEDGSVHGSGRDDYYNHGIYASGATYHQMAMVSPLFGPVITEDGISMGFESTRFTGFHVGANGSFSDELNWKGLLTYTNNFGKYDGEGGATYDPSRKQGSVLGEIIWQAPDKKIGIAASITADHGSLFDEGNSTSRFGAMLTLCYRIK